MSARPLPIEPRTGPQLPTEGQRHALTALLVRRPRRTGRGWRRAPWLIVGGLLGGLLAVSAPAAVLFNGSPGAGRESAACAPAAAVAETSGTVVSHDGGSLVLEGAGCRLELAVSPRSQLPDGLAPGDRIVARHAPGVLVGTRVVISARPLITRRPSAR